MPLNNIPSILSPQLLYNMSAAGHGDTIVLADAHFPTASICRCGPTEVRADGHSVIPLLNAILKFFPLDTYDDSVALMGVEQSDKDGKYSEKEPSIWQSIYDTMRKNDCQIAPYRIKKYQRFEFYEEAKKSFCVVATGESAQYANIILRKGIAKTGDDDGKE